MSAELSARVTSARALLSDYRRWAAGETIPGILYWRQAAERLASALADVLSELSRTELPAAHSATRLAEIQMTDIRAILAAFDWEFDDRQLALERIEQIARTA